MITRPLAAIALLSLGALARAQSTPGPAKNPEPKGESSPAAQPETAGNVQAIEGFNPEPEPQRWTLEAAAAAYYVAPGGKITMPSSTVAGQQMQMEDLNLDSPRISPLIELSLRNGRWGANVSGFYFDTNNNQATQDQAGQIGNIIFAAGDRLESNFTFWSAEAEAFYRLYNDHVLRDADGEESLLVSLDLRFGARAYDISTNMTSVSGVSLGETTSADQFFIEPIIGAKGSMDIYTKFSLALETTVGYGPWGDSSTYSWDIMVSGAWRPVKNVGVLIGYRQLLVNLQNGDGADEFQFRGAMAGVFAGVELRF